MATYWENSCSFGLRYVSWYKCLIVSNNVTREEKSLYANCIQKAEFLLFMLLSSCIYKTETKILIAATHINGAMPKQSIAHRPQDDVKSLIFTTTTT